MPVRYIALPWLCISLSLFAQEAPVKIHEELRTFPTYDVGEPDPNPQFALFKLGQYPAYPYDIVRPPNKTRALTQWRVIVLENEYLSCRILPDLGGHLHGCTDRITGKEIFYANPAIRRTEDFVRGGFLATGIESSFPITHSRNSGWPIDYAWSVHEGIGHVFVETMDRPSGMQWRVEFVLRPGAALLEQHGSVYNASTARQGYQWWVNAAVEMDDPHLRVVYPTHWMLPHGPGEMTPWPVGKDGRDLTDPNNHFDQGGLFAHLSREPWMAIYKPKYRSGLAHYADATTVSGKKIWIWGTKWNQLVLDSFTEHFNPYVEMQAGELETQAEFTFLQPGETKTYNHYWIPFRDLGGVARATPDAVLNLSRQGNSVTVELSPTHVMKGLTLRLSEGTRIVSEGPIDLDPRVKFAQTAEASKLTVDLVNQLGTVVLHHVEGEINAARYDPNAKNPQPEQTTDHSDGEAISLFRGNFNEVLDQWNFAWNDYESALKRSPDSLKLKVSEGRAAVALNRYDDAIQLLKDASHSNAEAAFYYGVALAASSDHVADAQAALSTAANDPTFAFAARLQLAQLAAREEGASGLEEATRIVHSLAAKTNAPPRVGALEVALLRRAGKTQEAQTRLRFWLLKDPADALLRVERIFNTSTDEPALWSLLAGDPERVLALADQYRQIGAYDDALKLLEHHYAEQPVNQRSPGASLPQDYPLVAYYRGYFKKKLGQDPKPDFDIAAKQSTLYVFPHREIEYRILKAALEQNENDATAHDLLGDLYFDSNRATKAMAEWQHALAFNKNLPALHRNLGLALLDYAKDPAAALRVLQEGVMMAPNDGELAHAFERANKLAGATSPSAAAQPAISPNSPPPNGADVKQVLAEVTTTAMAPKGDLATIALLRSVSDAYWSNNQFISENFPKDKQPDSVRQAYLEVQLRLLITAASDGHCKDAMAHLPDLGEMNDSLPFTFSKFAGFMKQSHFQYYIGVLENKCGSDKAAQKRWSKVSKTAEPSNSPDFVFPYLAAKRLGEPDAVQRIAAALDQVKIASPDQAAPAVLFCRGALLVAYGNAEQGTDFLRKAAQSNDTFIQYLSLAVLADGPGK